MKNNNEKQTAAIEKISDADRSNTFEHNERLRDQRESLDETLSERNRDDTEKARAEALERAVSSEKLPLKNLDKTKKTPERRGIVSKKERQASFNRTMKEVQNEMSAPDRTFSKIIHNKAVESGSEFIGNTIARPNAMFAGSLTAFILTFAVYMMAKTLGYPLSGFETIAAFVLGWIIGILFDYFKIMITGKK